MITQSVTIGDIDVRYLTANDLSTDSARCRRALRDEFEIRGVNPDVVRGLLQRAQEPVYSFDEITAQTNRFDDLEVAISDEPTASDTNT